MSRVVRRTIGATVNDGEAVRAEARSLRSSADALRRGAEPRSGKGEIHQLGHREPPWHAIFLGKSMASHPMSITFGGLGRWAHLIVRQANRQLHPASGSTTTSRTLTTINGRGRGFVFLARRGRRPKSRCGGKVGGMMDCECSPQVQCG